MTATKKLRAEDIASAVLAIDALASATYRTDYSGREMYGRTCVAVVMPSAGDLIPLGMSIASVIAGRAVRDANVYIPHAIDDAIGMFSGARVDSLGIGIVVYWPEITMGKD